MKNIIYLIFLNITLLASCDKFDSSKNASTGQGGSTARFCIVNNALFTISGTTLKTYDLSEESQPILKSSVNIGWGVETIFTKDSYLYFGTTTGMLIYNISNPYSPSYLNEAWHVSSCDPVVVEGNYAYVTLSSESWCGHNTNELQIYDISDKINIKLIKTYSMVKPKGLGIDGKWLFVSDNGLKIFDATDISNLQLKHTFNIPANDVIPLSNNLLVTASDGFYQYLYENDTIKLQSKISVNQK